MIKINKCNPHKLKHFERGHFRESVGVLKQRSLRYWHRVLRFTSAACQCFNKEEYHRIGLVKTHVEYKQTVCIISATALYENMELCGILLAQFIKHELYQPEFKIG